MPFTNLFRSLSPIQKNIHYKLGHYFSPILFLSLFFDKKKKNDNDLFVPYDIQTYLDIIIMMIKTHKHK